MLNFAANLSFLFGDVPFLDRFERAARAGFKGVEYLFPYDYAPGVVAAHLTEFGLTQALFNAPPGDWDAGERGLAAIPGCESRFRASIDQALVYADATGVRRIHVMAGLASERNAFALDTYRSNLDYAACKFSRHDVILLIEPINRRDMPGYFLSDFDTATSIIKSLDSDNVRLQFDVYHRQIIRGDVTVGLRELFPLIEHIQIAGAPERHEPDSGELSLSYIFSVLDELRYDGWIGCEYRPSTLTEEGLGWFQSFNRGL